MNAIAIVVLFAVASVHEVLLGVSDGGEPSVAAGRGLLIYTANGHGPLYRSADHGQSWQVGVRLGLGDNGVSIGTDTIIATLIWNRTTTGATRSADGVVWDPVSAVQDEHTAFLFPDGKHRVPCTSKDLPFLYDFPKVSAQRMVYVVAQSLFDVNDNGACDLPGNRETIIQSSDGGVTFDHATIVPGSTQRFFNVAQANGSAVLAGLSMGCRGITIWHIANGASMQDCALAIAPHATSVAVDPKGKAWVAYEYALGPGHHIGVASAGGVPVQIDDVLPTDTTDRVLPTLSIADNGRLDLAWIDFRNSQDHVSADVYYASSTDGMVWSANTRISTHTAPMDVLSNDYITCASDGGAAVIAYAQKQPDGSFAQYVARIGG